MSDEILPKQSEIYQLGAAQLADLQKFIAASDARPEDASLRYSTAIKRMDDLAVVDGIDPTGGKIAATAAQIGTLRGDPWRMLDTCNPLLSRMQKEFGMEHKDLDVLRRMQDDYGKLPDNPGHVADILSRGMQYLRGRQESGVDTSAARIAFLANGLALTRDPRLRSAIFSDLSQPR